LQHTAAPQEITGKYAEFAFVDIESDHFHQNKGKITASDFKQEKTGMYVKEDIVPYPIVKLPAPDNINVSPEVYQKLSEIIDEINSRTGQNFDRDVAVKSMLQLRDIMLKSDDLKASARNNTASNFEISFYNQLDDILVEGYEQNQDFFSLLLSNEGIKHQAMGIFADEVYRELRENQMNV
jgi:type I restriction enzyme R subunit